MHAGSQVGGAWEIRKERTREETRQEGRLLHLPHLTSDHLTDEHTQSNQLVNPRLILGVCDASS
jgi:hypothetical protein